MLRKLALAAAVTMAVALPIGAASAKGHGGYGGHHGHHGHYGYSYHGHHHHHHGRFWHGRWWAYGIGSCWRWSPTYGEYVWVCY